MILNVTMCCVWNFLWSVLFEIQQCAPWLCWVMMVLSYFLPFSATLNFGKRYVITGTKSVEQGCVEWHLFCAGLRFVLVKKIHKDGYLWQTQKQVSLFSGRFYKLVAHHQHEPESLYKSNKKHKLNITWMKFYIHATVKTNTNSYDKKRKWSHSEKSMWFLRRL